jgi:beta-glucosidase-like glycosyl hydrolase/predicted acylesterase/phospholipase RssA
MRDIVLCLSGGGFRATLFHLGVVEYLRAASALVRVSDVYSVSGGSILAAHLALNWADYAHGEPKDATNVLFKFIKSDVRAQVLQSLAGLSLVTLARDPIGSLRHLEERHTELLVESYSKFYERKSVSALMAKDGPAFHLLTTSLSRGLLCEFVATGFARYSGHGRQRIGKGDTFPLGRAVAASSAFPPLFPPVGITHDDIGATREALGAPEYLSDGGVFDNRGLDVARHAASGSEPKLLIVSDASARFDWETGTFWNVVERAGRAAEVLMHRVDALIDRMPKAKNARTRVVSIHDSLPKPPSPLPEAAQHQLGAIRTDLDAFSDHEIRALFQHGFEIAQKTLAADLSDTAGPRAIPDPLPTGTLDEPELVQALKDGSRARLGPAVTTLKKRVVRAAGLAALLLVLVCLGIGAVVGRGIGRRSMSTPAAASEHRNTSPELSTVGWPAIAPLPAEEALNAVAELFLVGLGDEYVSVRPQPAGADLVGAQLRSVLANHHVSGILMRQENVSRVLVSLSRRDYRSAQESVQSTLAEVQRAGGGTENRPLLIAVDAEGGAAYGLRAPLVVDAPSPMALGSLRSKRLVEDISFRVGSQLRGLGVNLNLAPVLDVNINQANDLIRERSFGGHFTLVSALGRAAVRGYQRAGLATCAKHYPGHGNTERTRRRAEEIGTPPESRYSEADFVSSLEPFRVAVAAGVDAIETSHFRLGRVKQAVVTADDWYISLLRERDTALMRIHPAEQPWVRPLGFQGAVISDDVLSYWISGTQTSEERKTYVERITRVCLDAIKAGHDLLIVGAIRADEAKTQPVQGYYAEISAREFASIIDSVRKAANDDPAVLERIRSAIARNRSLRERVATRTKGTAPAASLISDEAIRKAYRSSFYWTQLYDGQIMPPIRAGEVLLTYEKAPARENRLNRRLVGALRSVLSTGDTEDSRCRGQCDPTWHCSLCVEQVVFPTTEGNARTEPIRQAGAAAGSDDEDDEILGTKRTRLQDSDYSRAAEAVIQRARYLRLNKIAIVVDSQSEALLASYIAASLDRGGGRDLGLVPIITAHPNLETLFAGDIGDKMLRDGVLFAFSGQDVWAEQLAEVLVHGRESANASSCDVSREGLLRADLPVVVPGFRGTPSWNLCDDLSTPAGN